MRCARLTMEWLVFGYFLCYLPNVVLTRLVTSSVQPDAGRPMTGLEVLPASLILNTLLTLLFVWLAGWHRDAHATTVAGLRLPRPTRHTLLSGIGTALILFTVPLSLTFRDVSIPFIQLLMRGDILVIAPLVDLMFRRRVRWWSWVALLMVAVALTLVVRQRGGLKLPPLALLTVILYTAGYFIRLAVMNRVGKTGDAAAVRRYFVEEKLVALPLAVLCLAGLSASGLGAQAGQLEWGFVRIWSSAAIWPIVGIAITLTVVSVLSVRILLDARENTYCVPLERASSLLAGIGGAWLLHWGWQLSAPTGIEMTGALLLIAAIVLLSVAPRLARSS
jgi:hypothetical protein